MAQVRSANSRSRKVRKFFKAVVILGLFTVFAWGTVNAVHAANHEISATNVSSKWIALTAPAAEASDTMAPENLADKINAEKESILDRLSKCESGGKSEEDGIAILDTNNVGSYGAFQFQRKTVMYYYEKMTGQKINGRDALILALTPDKARDLARWVIFNTDAGIAKDWVNCSAKLGLQSEVDVIKKLTN